MTDPDPPPRFQVRDPVEWTTATGRVRRGTVSRVGSSYPWTYVVVDDRTLTELGVGEFQLRPATGT